MFPQGNKRGELKPFYPISKQSLPPVLATPVGAEIWLNFKLPNGVGSAYRRLAVGEAPNAYDAEPNDMPSQANAINLPSAINGRFEKPKDRDWYAVNLTKGDRVRFTGATRTLGSPCDLMLRVTDAAGKTLAESKITGDSDGEVSAEAKSDGVHFCKFANWPSRQGNTWFIELKQNECNPVFRSPSLNTLLLQKRMNHSQ